MDIKSVSLIGAGAWGTTIAKVIADNNPEIKIFLVCDIAGQDQFFLRLIRGLDGQMLALIFGDLGDMDEMVLFG